MTWTPNLATRELVGYLGWLFFGFVTLLAVWTALKRSRPKHAEKLMRWTDMSEKKFHQWRGRIKYRGTAHARVLSLLFALAAVSWLCIYAYATHVNVVTEHNVVIVRQLPDGDWQMSSDEDPDLVYRPCPDDLAAGIDVNGLFREASAEAHDGIAYVADRATWEERGTCKSIIRPEWQFWFKDQHNNFTYQRRRVEQ